MERMSVQYRPCFIRFTPLFPLLFLFASLSSASAQIAGGAADCAVPHATDFLNTRLSFWQQRLNLQDWRLAVVQSHPVELKPETLGNIHWDKDNRSATIHVLAVSDYKTACPAALEDMELTVVHELIHLTLAPLRSASTNRGDEERAVNQIADALLKLERKPLHQTAPVVAFRR
jgi:hypothetical protein